MNADANFDYLKYMNDPEDKKALLSELMNAYGKEVWNYAFSLTRKWDLADDISQEVFIKVFKNLHNFRSDASIRTWLLTITRNTVIDHHRSAFLRKVTLTDWIGEVGERQSVEEDVIERYAVNDLWKLVLKLPAKSREVLILYAHHQLSLKEIAEVLGVTEGTVKSRMFHARRKIAKMKERNGYGTE
ncbi:RNA polymerase sigma factor [Cohnella sp. REN36]|uniref:RNA polymerase sigma factor n=1 Tax=Cohnella sp. REN36 TaxID=2887347 RepID=UPI001D1428DB|nr:sigma-70 family RNA polymerase sigma factor [Cohnella sp. REN36]MCC3376481.1 sigma-70 family RNA polymerase sigma factor [Cohnella sp. REN36]